MLLTTTRLAVFAWSWRRPLLAFGVAALMMPLLIAGMVVQARQEQAGTLLMPVKDPTITQPFGCTALEIEPWSAECPSHHFHSGIDLAAPLDTPIYAATAGMSAYHSLQTKVEKQFTGGLNFLFAYTWSKTMTDAGDLLNGGGVGNVGFRAPNVPGLGMPFDYGLAAYDVRNVFHFSGGYELPFGHGKRFMGDASGFKDKAIGGWSVIWSIAETAP